MKKLITICLLIATTFSAKAQDMNFEETVKYINDIFKENSISYFKENSNTSDLINGISVKKDGKIICYNAYKGSNRVPLDQTNEILFSFNLFDFTRLSYEDKFQYFIKNVGGDVKYLDWGFFYGITEPNIMRLNKALTHLRTLCVKTADPFGK
jgi:hypothetical protein